MATFKDKRLKHVVIKDSARKEELSVFLVLHEFFNKQIVIVGDKPSKDSKDKLCDIYTEDKNVGIEVVSYETLNNYPLNKEYYSKLGLLGQGEGYVYFTKHKNPSNVKAQNKKKHRVFVALSSAASQCLNFYPIEDNVVVADIAYRILDKFNKLNELHYSSVKHMNLAIFTTSTLEEDVKFKIRDVFNDVRNKSPQKFENLFIIDPYSVYQVNINGEISKEKTLQGKEIEFLH